MPDPPPKILVVDLTMPGRSGLDLIDHVREARPELPVVVITGLAATAETATSSAGTS